MKHKQQHVHDSYCSKDFHTDVNEMLLELIVEGYLYNEAIEMSMGYQIDNGIPVFDVDITRYDV